MTIFHDRSSLQQTAAGTAGLMYDATAGTAGLVYNAGSGMFNATTAVGGYIYDGVRESYTRKSYEGNILPSKSVVCL